MDNRRPGFTILEITVVMLVGSIMITSLYIFFSGLSGQGRYGQAMMQFVEQSATAEKQLTEDIGAVFVPEETIKKMAQAVKKSGEKAKGGEKKEEKKQIYPFVCSIKNKQFDYLAFISTHQLPRYQRRKPFPVFIVYHFEPDTLRKDIFHLVRYETDDFDMTPEQVIKKGTGFRLISNISSLGITFTIPVTKKEGEQKANPEPLKSWDAPEIFKEHKTLIPLLVQFEGELNIERGTLQKQFIFVCPVYTFDDQISQIKTELKKEPQAPQEQPKGPQVQQKTQAPAPQKPPLQPPPGQGLFGPPGPGSQFQAQLPGQGSFPQPSLFNRGLSLYG